MKVSDERARELREWAVKNDADVVDLLDDREELLDLDRRRFKYIEKLERVVGLYRDEDADPQLLEAALRALESRSLPP